MKEFEIKDCGIKELDSIKNEIILEFYEWRKQYISAENNEFLAQKSKELEIKLLDFRMKMAYKKGTEFIEGYFGWTEVFDQMKSQLNIMQSDA